ncbi:MAG: carotenoid biosynthesis protein [Marinilabiliaceae bacterium]
MVKNLKTRYLIPEKVNRFWVIYFMVGVAGLTFPLTRSFFRELIGFSLVLALGLMMYFHKPWNKPFILASVIVAIIGFLLEAWGVNTGTVFGHYNYGDALGPKFLDTPLLIGLNWWMLIYIVAQITENFKVPVGVRLILGSLIMVGYDVVMEPVATATGMWDWNAQPVPFQNYLAWFIISFVFLSVFRIFKLRYNNPVAAVLLAAQTGFFVLLNIIEQLRGL